MNPVATFFFIAYSIIHIQFVWAAFVMLRWNKLVNRAKLKKEEAAFCKKYAFRLVLLIGVDVFIILPAAIQVDAVFNMIPWTIVKAGVLILIFAQPGPRR